MAETGSSGDSGVLAPFPRHAVIERLRSRLWSFLRSSAAEHEIGHYVEALWSLTPGQFDELVATHLGLLDLTGEMLAGIEAVLPRLPSSVRRHEQELVGFVHGPVDWPKTQLRRVATADPTLFVCRPPERRYDTPPARLCHAALVTCASLSALSGLAEKGQVGTKVHARSNAARLLLRHPKLRPLRSPRPPRQAATDRLLRRWPELEPAADFLGKVDASLRRRDATAIRSVIEERLLVPSADDDLFELLVAFDVIDALRERHGCVDTGRPELLGRTRTRVPLARLSSSQLGEVVVWWDRSVWLATKTPAAGGALWAILAAAGMVQQPFRPDVVVDFVDRGRVVPIEVKVTTKEDRVADERGAIQEALAYLHDAHVLFSGQPWPHAAVVAWNATGMLPSADAAAEVLVCDQSHVHNLLDRIVASL